MSNNGVIRAERWDYAILGCLDEIEQMILSPEEGDDLTMPVLENNAVVRMDLFHRFLSETVFWDSSIYYSASDRQLQRMLMIFSMMRYRNTDKSYRDREGAVLDHMAWREAEVDNDPPDDHRFVAEYFRTPKYPE